MTPWSPGSTWELFRDSGWESGKRLQLFSFFLFFCLFPFFSFFFVLFCFVFEERVSLCILGHPKTHSVNQAILELREICLPLPPRVLGWKARPHHHTQPGWERSGCPGPLVSEDGFVCVVNLYDESLCPMLQWHESEASSKRVWHPPLDYQASSESTWLRSLNKA